ncbi:Phosphoribosylformylglycinamidine cyclo-ligase [hydrothermal vent metagenome]|uniref:Phosphoribosylformylglycinamidine cyclo-ligase n=1 Tax=hydrothermal vent metagenome TaxID=652676 RepID=A0A3B0TJN7_9ZZZZ
MPKSITYKSAGVDIDKGNDFVRLIKKDVKGTFNKSVLQRSGSFGALFELAGRKYKEPVLVSSTDGVGTKLLMAQAVNKHNTVGIDLVAMNVNDILCVGAKPLFFLDYIACGKLNPKVLKSVVSGIAKGCKLSGCALIGGETAEMPGMYKPQEYDLAGFAVGIIDKKKIIDGSKIVEGDCVLGLSSSGFHSNGYSLVRKVFSLKEQKELSSVLLKPTKIYSQEIDLLLKKFSIKAIAHMTGGAFYEKLTKVLPKGKCFSITKGSWPIPKIFSILQKKGRIDESQMYKTFNMGIGLSVVLAKKDIDKVQAYLKSHKIKSYKIGTVIRHRSLKVQFCS